MSIHIDFSRAGIRHADSADFTFFLERFEHARLLFNRNRVILPVGLIQVDYVRLQSLETTFYLLADSIGTAVDEYVETLAGCLAGLIKYPFTCRKFLVGAPLLVLGEAPPHHALRCEPHTITPIGDRLSDNFLASTEAIDRCCTDQVPASVQKSVDGADRLLFIGPSPGPPANCP